MELQDLELKRIIAPTLTSSNYGRDIRDVFENIDSNFRILANHDFIRGEAGESIRIESVKIAADATGVGLDLYNLLTSYINEHYDTISLSYIEVTPAGGQPIRYDWNSGIQHVDEITQNIAVYYTLKDQNAPDDPDNRLYINTASLYLLKDRRFDADVIQVAERSQYATIQEVSAAFYFYYGLDDSGVERWNLQEINSTPTLYFDINTQTFCWKFNGQESGIRAQGAPGIPGSSTPTWIVRAGAVEQGSTNNSIIYPVSQILIKDPESTDGRSIWIDSSSPVWESTVSEISDGAAAIVFGHSDQDSSVVFISNIIKISNSDIRVTLNDNLVQQLADDNWLYEALRHIMVSDATTSVDEPGRVRGLFLPTGTNKNGHMLYHRAENVQVYERTGVNVDTLHISPVLNYDDHTDLSGTNFEGKKFDDGYQALLSIDYPCTMIKGGLIVRSTDVDEIQFNSGNSKLNILSGAIGVESSVIELKTGTNRIKIDNTPLYNGIAITSKRTSIQSSTQMFAVGENGIDIVSGPTGDQSSINITGPTISMSADDEVYVNSDLRVTKQLYVNGNTTVSQDLTVRRNATVSQDLTVNGNIDCDNNIGCNQFIKGTTKFKKYTPNTGTTDIDWSSDDNNKPPVIYLLLEADAQRGIDYTININNIPSNSILPVFIKARKTRSVAIDLDLIINANNHKVFEQVVDGSGTGWYYHVVYITTEDNDASSVYYKLNSGV